jgi:hypothetical protein
LGSLRKVSIGKIFLNLFPKTGQIGKIGHTPEKESNSTSNFQIKFAKFRGRISKNIKNKEISDTHQLKSGEGRIFKFSIFLTPSIIHSSIIKKKGNRLKRS